MDLFLKQEAQWKWPYMTIKAYSIPRSMGGTFANL